MPETDSNNDAALKSISKARIEKLMKIDEFLTRRGRDGNPASIAEICEALGIKGLNQTRGIRKNIDSLCNLSSDTEDFPFKITRCDRGKSVKYMIEPGHSLFHRTLSDLFGRDLTLVEKKLINDLFSTLGSFDIPGLKHIEDLTKEATGGLSAELANRKCIDLGLKAPEQKSVFSGLFEAIAMRKEIRLSYRPVRNLSDSDFVPSQILFRPCRLRRFGDRWAVIGVDAKDGFILKFYLDQIVSFEVTETVFDQSNIQRISGIFDNVIGMDAPRQLCEPNSHPDEIEEPQDIYVWVDPLRVQYLRTFPLHDTMDELDEECGKARELRRNYPGLPEGGSFFYMSAYVTHSLKQLLVSYIDRMIVLEPEDLRLDLERRIRHMSDIYGSLTM